MSLVDLLCNCEIVKIKSIDEEAFTLKSGKKSRFFFDIKEASLNPTILKAIVDEIDKIDATFVKRFDKIGSVAVGGIPIATALSLKTGVPQIIVKSEKHETGTKSKIIGDCRGDNVLLIEDVATSGGSIIEAINDIHKAGGKCHHCIVVLNRQEGADEMCARNYITLHPILVKADFGIEE